MKIFTFKYNCWHVLYKVDNGKWNWLEGSDRYWYADPMLYEWKGKKYLFVEAYDFLWSVGKIAVSEWDGTAFGTPKVIIKKPYHMSYPFVFEYQDELYMLPETCQNKTMELYKAENDCIYKWRKVKTLLDNVTYVDSTVVLIGDMHYILTYEENKPEFRTHIFRLNMERLEIEKLETVISYENTCRPAGRLFEKNGNMYRPIQLNTQRYGGGIGLERINSFIPFSASRVKDLLVGDLKIEFPIGKGLGVHTLAMDDELYIVDVLVSGKKIFAPWVIIVRKARRLIYRILKK